VQAKFSSADPALFLGSNIVGHGIGRTVATRSARAERWISYSVAFSSSRNEPAGAAVEFAAEMDVKEEGIEKAEMVLVL
jgi:hypothetical protein